jgi:hypothetical protein
LTGSTVLVRLLRNLLARRSSRRPAPQSSRPPPAAAASRAGSQLALLSSLASLASGQPLQVTGKEAPAAALDTSAAELPVERIIAHAAALARGALAPGTLARVERYAAAYDAAARRGAPLNAFLFHADLPPGERIEYVDARLAPHEFDYLDILRRCIDRVRSHCPGARIYLTTSPGSRYRALDAPDVSVVELPLAAAEPMFERACALLAYAGSAAFDADTLFLDSDALVNRPIAPVFGLGFDIGLTYRQGERLMPVNEGVIFLGAREPAAVRRFLEHRLAVYEQIAADSFIRGYYQDVRRWRGGQLSLNALAAPCAPFGPYRPATLAGARVRFLPGDTFNFAGGEGEDPGAIERLAERFVVHFKGSRKHAFGFAARAEAGRR